MTRTLALALCALPPMAALPALAQPTDPSPISARPTLPPRPDMRFDPSIVPDPARVMAVLDYTALAQIDALATQPLKLRSNQIREATANWVAAAFYTGAGRLARSSPRPEILAFLREVAEHYNYGFRGGSSPRAMINADDQAIGELYLELHARAGQPGMILPLKQRMDFTLASLTREPAPERLTWWWCDALFMAPPVLARLAAVTRDPAYLHAMDVQWWRTYDRLWDPEEKLYFRDERFVTRRSANGKKIFWSRGMGWVVGGYARVLEAMPADYPSRPRYIEAFRAMTARLLPLQRADGMWTASLLDPEVLPGPEASGSAFMVYAMAWGINHGILDRETYLPHVLRGWAGLTAVIQPDGLLGHVQRTGDQPVPTAPEDKGLYGTGALILAGLEIARLNAAPTSLPLAEPARDPTWTDIAPLTPPPAGAPYEQRRGYEERVASRALAYDPSPPAVVAPGDGKIAMPRADLLLAPPPVAEQKPRASVTVAPYRYDDVLWENDRTAHRIYGRALEAHEPPSTSGIDAWGKNVRWPFMERQIKTGKQHDYHGEGIDYYNVGTTRGAGGLGIWHDNRLWTSRNYRSVKIVRNGPDVADFEISYAPWPVDVNRKVWETRRFTLPLGTNFTRMVSTISSDSAAPLTVAVGIAKRGTSQTLGKLSVDRARGTLSLWGPTDADKGTMAVALLVDPRMIAEIREDADNYLVLLKVTPGKPFVYYMGAAWDKGPDFHSEAEWNAYVARQRPEFDPAKTR